MKTKKAERTKWAGKAFMRCVIEGEGKECLQSSTMREMISLTESWLQPSLQTKQTTS